MGRTPTGRGFWAEQARELLSWETPFTEVLDWSNAPFVALVRRRHAQRRVQRGRPARRGGPRRPGRAALRGRGRRHPHRHLRRPAARGVQGRERVHRAGRRHGRPRRHLPAADPRGRRHDARVRAHRRRRTRSCSAGSRPRRCARRIDDAEAKLVVTADGGYRRGSRQRAQAGRRRGADQGHRRRSSTCSSCSAPARTSPGTTGRDVWWHDAVDAASRPAHARARSRPSTRCSSSTRRAPPGSPRASSTPPAAT